MFCPPASTPPMVASGEACSLIIAMPTLTGSHSSLWGITSSGLPGLRITSAPSARRVPRIGRAWFQERTAAKRGARRTQEAILTGNSARHAPLRRHDAERDARCASEPLGARGDAQQKTGLTVHAIENGHFTALCLDDQPTGDGGRVIGLGGTGQP